MTNDICLRLADGESQVITVNGVECRFIRRDRGPSEYIEFQAAVRGYTACSRGSHVAQLSFGPVDRVAPMWDVV